MTSSLESKHALWSRELSAASDKQERLAIVVERGRKTGELPPDLKVDANLVPGCLSKLWFVAELREGRCWFRCDSDSAIVKGVASLLCEFYSGHTCAEIVETEPSFLAETGITQHLSANRRNGLARVRELIREFARNAAA